MDLPIRPGYLANNQMIVRIRPLCPFFTFSAETWYNFFGKNGVVYCPKVGKSVTDSFETVKITVYPETKMV